MPEQQDLTPTLNIIINEDDIIHVRVQRLPGNPAESVLVLEDDNSLMIDLKIDQV